MRRRGFLKGWEDERAKDIAWCIAAGGPVGFGAGGRHFVDSGYEPPAKWSISPANPGTSDRHQFSGPTKVYSNSCVAESSLGGTPQLSIDPVSKVILLWFKGPAPQACPKIYMPVCGLEGEFGPLASGEWTFTSLSKELDLEITFTVKGGLVRGGLPRGPRRSGAGA